MSSMTLAVCLVALPIGPGCDEPTADVAPPGGTPTAEAEPVGPGLPVDHPPVELAPVSRAPERLTVDMLQASLPIVAGDGADGRPITWTITRNNRAVEALSDEGLGRTLGRPDYVQVTEEPALPTPLYAKLMDDMARDVCAKIVVADLARPDASARTLTRFAPLAPGPEAADPAAVGSNLRYLMLRFHGQKIAADDEASIADLRALYDATSSGGADPRAGWTAVCVGLLVSPSFHIY